MCVKNKRKLSRDNVEKTLEDVSFGMLPLVKTPGRPDKRVKKYSFHITAVLIRITVILYPKSVDNEKYILSISFLTAVWIGTYNEVPL